MNLRPSNIDSTHSENKDTPYRTHQWYSSSPDSRLLVRDSISQRYASTTRVRLLAPRLRDRGDCRFAFFNKLPLEIQDLIWLHAIALPVVSEDPHGDGLENEQQTRLSVARVCVQSRRALRRQCPIFWRSLEGDSMPCDPENDLAKIMLPIIDADLPFERVLIERFAVLSMYEGEDGTELRTIPLNQPLALRSLPNVRELTMAFSFAPVDLWLGDYYQIYGPEARGTPPPGCIWHIGSRAPTISVRGQAYFKGGNFQGDTGVKWESDIGHVPHQFNGIPWHARFCSSDFKWEGDGSYKHRPLPFATDMSRFVPNVGFRGFSRDSTSCGGMWAGFRYYEDFPGLIEFSPLSWDEVKDAMYGCSHAGFQRKHFPELIIKVFIIRRGYEPPPTEHHHCWKRLKEVIMDDSPDDEDRSWEDIRLERLGDLIALMWRMVLNQMAIRERGSMS